MPISRQQDGHVRRQLDSHLRRNDYVVTPFLATSRLRVRIETASALMSTVSMSKKLTAVSCETNVSYHAEIKRIFLPKDFRVELHSPLTILFR